MGSHFIAELLRSGAEHVPWMNVGSPALVDYGTSVGGGNLEKNLSPNLVTYRSHRATRLVNTCVPFTWNAPMRENEILLKNCWRSRSRLTCVKKFTCVASRRCQGTTECGKSAGIALTSGTVISARRPT